MIKDQLKFIDLYEDGVLNSFVYRYSNTKVPDNMRYSIVSRYRIKTAPIFFARVLTKDFHFYTDLWPSPF